MCVALRNLLTFLTLAWATIGVLVIVGILMELPLF
jgi:hypothetical protein